MLPIRDRIDNNELLTYQLHCMRDKVAKLEAAQVNYEQLLTENKVKTLLITDYDISLGIARTIRNLYS